MTPVVKQWHLVPHDDATIRRLTAELRIPLVVAQLLVNRGVRTADAATRFLNPVLTALHPPEKLPGVTAGAERVVQAIRDGRRIRVFGDYDADGVTGTAILYRLIDHLGGVADFYIPHRLDEGYGLNVEAIRKAKADGVGLMITVDCGITAVEEAEEARRQGVELIITDHHEPKDELPNADVLVHPRLPGGYPFDGLSGAGVAFKLAWVVAQLASNNQRVTPELRELLLDCVGLAALGLVADVVPLQDENRIFVKHGLARIAARPLLGLKALLEASKLKDAAIKAEDVSFRLAPRLNAAGRLGCALLVVELLTTKSPVKAREIAECLEGYNTQRQTIERRIATQAREMIAEHQLDGHSAFVLGSADWHQGVVGIVAGRLTEQFGKPTILVSLRPNDEPSTGSGRSIVGVELHEVLKDCEAVLESYGGHAFAAGVKVRPSNLDTFRTLFSAAVTKRFPNGLPRPRLVIDAEIPLASLTFGLMKDIDRLEPYGADNPKPRFLATALTIEGTPRRMGQGERHLSFRVRQGTTLIRAVAFGMGDRFDELMSAGGKCSLVFSPRLNEWQGYRSVEIEVTDFRAGHEVILE
ncbi:single-stranded-DNA-specific exonuclease RecJ [Limnoglobus roseus]|uniref:Single-stranded-DNA-specific exonuclease RecJ n=1 Tax=Limnoglobus roseus TaxID=2598579 RepID=A0A5C1A3G1_9BACT|nr:single-stranded-DNA-specific exonuclease RecJ [Limnoglobus roseus]QEL13609.1 single-stranded-DNA-specific exonuclease RecJ [Limnoglobus roseus]